MDTLSAPQEVRPNHSLLNKLVLRTTLLAGFMVGVSFCARAEAAKSGIETVWPTKQWMISTPGKEGLDSKELAKLVDFGTTHRFDSLLVARHGKIVAESYYSPYYRPGIAHPAYSVTKSVISTLLAIASRDGLLGSPNHRVLDFFDRRSIANLDQRKEAITVQNLLDMTSGLRWTEPQPNRISTNGMDGSPDWVKFVLDRPMSSAPGDTFNYSSGNTQLLSAIITKLTGGSALKYANAKLFGPLGIKDVYWLHDPQGISNGGWGLSLRPRDMAKIGYLYLRRGVWEDQQLIPPTWIDRVSHATIDTHLASGLRYSNLFWALPDKQVYMAVGYRGQVIMIFPDLDIVAVTTGRDFYSLGKFADLISRTVKSNTLPLATNVAPEKLFAEKAFEASAAMPH
jgi:CubicO group peptidase (beta-lactamase class C family)